MSSNHTIGFLINFYDFIKTHDIEIPRIQRDYTYGSMTEKTDEVLNKMLANIFDALLSPEKEFILDFVYGSRNDRNTFEPLDGQQRLTTLFLLYLYAGWTCGASLEEFHFNYSTRDNTANFCEALVSKDSFTLNIACWKCGSCTMISDQIRDCAFFRPSFNDDPSIKSMLNVIDRIDAKFKKLALEGKLWGLLTQNCPVKFYCLDFGKFGLSDDLYIKMNSRGKTLTDYEIFKSQLEKYIEVDLKDKEMMYEFAKKFDTDFTDLIWHEQHMDLSLIDDSFVTLFKNLLGIRNFLRGNTKSIVELKYLGEYLSTDTGADNKKKPTWYIEKEDVRFILDFFEEFHKVYRLSPNSAGDQTANDLVWGQVFYSSDNVRGDTPVGDSLEKIRVFRTDVNLFRTACNKGLRYADMVMLYAMYLTLKMHPLNSMNEQDIATWRKDIDLLRHIRNLIENSDDELSRPDFIASVMTDVKTILEGNIGTIGSSKFNSNQIEEEKGKAASPDRWKALYYYENHDIFRGALSLMAPSTDQGIFSISNDDVFDQLTKRLTKVDFVFDNDSKKKDQEIRAKLLSWGDFGQSAHSDTKRGRDNRMLGFQPASWRLLLTRNNYFDQSKILQLLDSLDCSAPLEFNAPPVYDWRYYASRPDYYLDTYVAYNMAKYGYYFIPEKSRPLEIFLLQSTSCADVENVMWKLLNRILWKQLLVTKTVAEGKCLIRDRKHCPEITIMDEFTIDCMQEGWKVVSKKDQSELVCLLRQIGYQVSDEGVVAFIAKPDYIQFGIKLVKDILAYRQQTTPSADSDITGADTSNLELY